MGKEELADLFTARMAIQGLLTDFPDKREIVDTALAELRQYMRHRPAELRASIAFLLFSEYAKDLIG